MSGNGRKPLENNCMEGLHGERTANVSMLDFREVDGLTLRHIAYTILDTLKQLLPQVLARTRQR